MSNPARAPKESTFLQLALGASLPDAFDVVAGFPYPFGKEGEPHIDLKTLGKMLKSPTNVQEILAPLDMEGVIPIVIPRELTVDQNIIASTAEYNMATAKNGGPQLRLRSYAAKTLASAFAQKLPGDAELIARGVPWTKLSREAAQQRCGQVVFADAGTAFTLGRLAQHYPRKGSTIANPVSFDEARAALGNCGLDLGWCPNEFKRPYPLMTEDRERELTVNPKSDNGFPVLGQWRTDGAATLVMGLARGLRAKYERAFTASGRKGVVEYVRSLEESVPHLMALRGKAKGDYYKVGKMSKAELRFYNAFPRQNMLIMQQATQPFEALARHIGQYGHSAIGATLVRGGARDMVRALDQMLDVDGWGYVHCGDDSWVVVRVDEDIVLFSLDCTAFDLTQHADATQAIHLVLADALDEFDPVAASVWYAYARERLVVTAGSHVRRWKHAGPSGMPLQSKVNDMLMDVFINRLVATVETFKGLSRTAFEPVVEQVGQDLGLKVRLEDWEVVRAPNLASALTQIPFLFIGYYFWAKELPDNDYDVNVCVDLARTIAQMVYPTAGWMDKRDLQVAEAVRLGSIALGLGLPPDGFENAFEIFRQGAISLLKDAALYARTNVRTDDLRWLVQENPFGPAAEPGLAGLQAALTRDPASLWGYEPPMASTSVFLSKGSWADELDNEEQRLLEDMLGTAPRAPAARQGPLPPMIPIKEPQHPLVRQFTLANDGRRPPIARWAPNKPPRVEPVFRKSERSAAPKKGRRRERQYIESEDFHSELWDSADE